MTTREKLPSERYGRTRATNIGGERVYTTVNFFDDGRPAEVFISIGKEGDVTRLLDAVAMSISIGLQHGIPLSVYTKKLRGCAYGEGGVTSDKDQPLAKSILDYVAGWLDRVCSETQKAR